MICGRTICGKQLYRTAALVASLSLMAAVPMWAQRGPREREAAPVPVKKKPAEKPPRAVGVMVWRADAHGMAQPRLLPFSIYYENKFYDASLYYATPRPMALESGNYYEVGMAGQRIGYFTVENAAGPKSSGEQRWAGLGEWENAPPRLEVHKLIVAPQAVSEGAALIIPEPDDGDLVKEKNKKDVTVYDEEGRPLSKEEAAKPEPERKGDPETLDRMPTVMKEKKKEPAPTAKTGPDDDPDRPHYKKDGSVAGAAAPVTVTVASAKKAAPESSEPNPLDDPDRPILKHGKGTVRAGGEKKSSSAPMAGTQPVPALVADGPSEEIPGGKLYVAVAVSDSQGVSSPGDFEFKAGEQEREELTEKMSALAEAEVEKFLQKLDPSRKVAAKKSVAKRAGKKPASTAPYFQRQEMRAFDLDFNNSAELVYTATRSEGTPKPVFITLVARVTIEGEPRKLFSSVTRADRLDAYPRLALVDAVDADGSGHGELLFRRVRGIHDEDFILYRVDPDELTELFHGGGTY